jgi:hypothetical protein
MLGVFVAKRTCWSLGLITRETGARAVNPAAHRHDIVVGGRAEPVYALQGYSFGLLQRLRPWRISPLVRGLVAAGGLRGRLKRRPHLSLLRYHQSRSGAGR